MELEATWRRAIKVWWSYLWRSLIAVVVAMIMGGVLGFIIGFVMGTSGAEETTVQIITAPLGMVIGLAVSIVPMKLILNKDFGEFRLALVPKQ